MTSLKGSFKALPGKVFGLVVRQGWLFMGAFVLVAFVLTGMVGLDVYLHEIHMREGTLKAENLSTVLADQTDRSLQSVLSVVGNVVELMKTQNISSVQALKAAAVDDNLQAMLTHRAFDEPFLDSVHIIGADGEVANPSRAVRSIVDSYGQAFVENLRDARNDAVYVSEPFQSLSTGTWQLSLSKRVTGRDGAFIGVVSGVVKLASLSALMDKIAPGEHGSISVFRDDGTILACEPQREIGVGFDIVSTDFYRDFIAKKIDGVMRQTSAADGVDRMFASVQSAKFPVVSVAAVAMGDIDAIWKRQVEALGLGFGLIALAILFGAVKLASHVEQLAASREREAVQAQIVLQNMQFSTAMNTIVQGLAMYDRLDQLVICNKRYAEIYGLPEKLTQPGVPRAKILAYRGAHGFGKAKSAAVTEPDGSVLIINELSDGRIIAQRKRRLADGGWVSTHEDITARCRAEEKVLEMATTDPLTGLANRFAFRQGLERFISEVLLFNGKFAVFYLDLDHFKIINDTLGHLIGDKLLQEVSARIKAVVREGDIVARLGGDEFAIIQRIESIPRDPTQMAERLLYCVDQPYLIDGNHIDIGASIGISLAPTDSFDADELIHNADVALYYSKVDRGSFTFFQPSMDDHARWRRQIEVDLRAALAEQQFELHYQPVTSTLDGRVKSFEALIRWKHPTRGDIAPIDFISFAEENGLIVQIGEWVLREACLEAAKWPEHIKVAVNISVIQFKSAGLLQAISGALRVAGIPGSRLIAEVTESVFIKDSEQAISILHAIRDMGIAVAMDDFGTGYSSLSYLRKFPFDKIKIDRSFINDLGARDDSVAIVRAATGLAKALGMEAVAEGVETQDQLTRVGLEGCSEAQGYLISPPMPAREVHNFLAVEPLEAPARMVLTQMLSAQMRKGAIEIPRGTTFNPSNVKPIRSGAVGASKASA